VDTESKGVRPMALGVCEPGIVGHDDLESGRGIACDARAELSNVITSGEEVRSRSG
jgi:hypothetical protein